MAPSDHHLKKQALLRALAESRKRLLDRCSGLDQGLLEIPFLGHWSIMELLAHLSGWDLANMEAAEAILAGRLPAFYQHHDRDWAAFNQMLIQRHLKADFISMLSSATDTHQQLLSSLEMIQPADFFKDFGLRFKGYKVILSRLLTAEAEDEAEHLEQVEAFARLHNETDCDATMPPV